MINWSENQFKMLYRNLIFEDYENFMDANARVKDQRCSGCAHDAAWAGSTRSTPR